ncbi:MAG: hypothetical protein HRT72_10015, partial [Flavobacteriales bacterium]|nr:hypothetical protein [Flavobacteriales bacterium]
FGCSSTLDSTTVVRIDSVIADFELDTNNIFAGDILTFTNSSFGNSYAWTFGPGSTPSISTIQNPSVSYTTSETFKPITLVMSSTFGCTDTLTQTVTVVEVPSSGSGQLCWVDTLSQTNANFNYGYQVLDQHVDYLGNTYVTGYVRDETAWPSSFSMFFVKYDNNGNEVWSKEQKGSDYVFGDDYSSSYGTCIATDLEGNVYVGGSFASEKLLLGSNTITFDRGIVQAFVIKYDALGNIDWTIHGRAESTQQNNTDPVGVTDILFNNKNEIYISARGVHPEFAFPDGSVIDLFQNQIFIFKINDNGDYLNHIVAGPGGYHSSTVNYDIMYSSNTGNLNEWTFVSPKLAQTKCNDILIVGNYKANAIFGQDTLVTTAMRSGYVVMADQNLTAWKHSFTTYGYTGTHMLQYSPDYIPSFTLDEDDNFYISKYWGINRINGSEGYSFQTFAMDIDNQTLPNRQGAVVIKYDINGNLQWYKNSPASYIKSMYAASNDNILLFGEYRNTLALASIPTAAYGLPPIGEKDLFIGSMNGAGTVNWLRSVGTTNEDKGFFMDGNKCGDIYFSGSMNGSTTMDGISTTSNDN